MGEHVAGEHRPAVPFTELDLDLGRAHLDQRELGRDEEPVQHHEQEGERDRDRRIDLEPDGCGGSE
ncbi:hypothetical protein D3C83_72270 [compost metagenome]